MVNSITGKTLYAKIPLMKSFKVPLCDIMDPVDYEDFIQQHQLQIDHDPLRHLMEFPIDDVEVGIMQRKCRTVVPVVPEDEG